MGEKMSQTTESSSPSTARSRKSDIVTMRTNSETKKLSPKKSSEEFLKKNESLKNEKLYPQSPKQKSVIIAYLLWIFGGFFGLHHLYLHRDRQAFIWWCTLGGYFGIGWISEIFKIPSMVRDANEDSEFIVEFTEKLRSYRKPQFSTNRFLGAIMVGYLWGQLALIAIPEEDYAGINWSYLHWVIPFFVALGVWTVGNVGREKGVLRHCLAAAYLTYPIRYVVYDETYWFTGMVFMSAIIFDVYSKEWRRTPPKRHGVIKRTVLLSTAVVIYLSLWSCYFYFNGKITDSEGDQVPVHEAIRNFLKSPWWTDLKQTFHDTWTFAKHNGWYETWKQIIDTMDADGEQNAYKVIQI